MPRLLSALVLVLALSLMPAKAEAALFDPEDMQQHSWPVWDELFSSKPAQPYVAPPAPAPESITPAPRPSQDYAPAPIANPSVPVTPAPVIYGARDLPQSRTATGLSTGPRPGRVVNGVFVPSPPVAALAPAAPSPQAYAPPSQQSYAPRFFSSPALDAPQPAAIPESQMTFRQKLEARYNKWYHEQYDMPTEKLLYPQDRKRPTSGYTPSGGYQ